MLGASLLFILLVAGYFRLSHNGWDDYHHYHPDERFLAWVGTSIEWPASLATAFQPRQSSFNPYYWSPDAETEGVLIFQDEPRRFAYGHLPLYLGVAATKLTDRLAPLRNLLPDDWTLTRYILNGANQVEYNHIVAAARVLTALVDLGTIFLTFLLARYLFSAEIALLAALLLALNVMHIQLAHFFTVDPYMTFFVMLTLYFLVTALPQENEVPQRRRAYLAAIAFGLAVGSKFSAIYLLFPFLLYARLSGNWRKRHTWQHLAGLMLAALLSFAVTNPFAVLDWSCTVLTPAVSLGPIRLPPLNWANCYLENIVRQQQMVSGASDLGFTRQYSHTFPFLYYIEMQLKWGMGLPLGLAAFAGLFWA
ncbi:MAG: glycosyltransferase family 39 protein, partial [Anaerolineales bacterium]|nr:glycosyltransferase family 39 protein [Anaerolineales bacterium]